jgi:hypothetical protein
LLSAPQAFFGLVLGGWVLRIVIGIITVGAWITVIQRLQFVYHQTSKRSDAEPLRLNVERSNQLPVPEKRSVHS